MPPLLTLLLFAFAPISPALPSQPSGRSAKPSVPPALFAPRAVRQIPDWTLGMDFVLRLKAATPKRLLLEVEKSGGGRGTRRVVALARGADAVQWEDEARGMSVPYQSIGAFCRVLGSVSVQNGKPLTSPVLVMEWQLVFTRDDPRPQTGPRYETQTTLYGMDEARHITWQFPPPPDPPMTVRSDFPDMSGLFVSELFAPIVGGLVAVRTGKSDALTFLNAQTGVPVDTSTPEGKTTLTEAIRQNGSPLLQTSGQLYRLDTGAVVYNVPLGFGSGQVQDAPLGVTADRAFWQGGGDDGWTGHSAYPTYLTVIDEKGKPAWVFPENKERDYGYGGGSLDPSLGSFVLTNARQSGDAVAVVSVTRKLRDGNTLFGLQARRGTRLWQRDLPGILDLAAQSPKASGVFVLRRGATKTGGISLDYLNAATGKTQKTWSLPKTVNRIMAADDDLLLIDDAGVVRIYSCQKLLGK